MMYENVEKLIECGWSVVYAYSNWDPGNAMLFIPEIEEDWKSTAIEAILELLDTEYEGSCIINQYIKEQDLPLIVRGDFDKCIRKFEDSINAIKESERMAQLAIAENTFKKFMLACIQIIKEDATDGSTLETAANKNIGWGYYYHMSELK